jgi:potassium efflux system protein
MTRFSVWVLETCQRSRSLGLGLALILCPPAAMAGAVSVLAQAQKPSAERSAAMPTLEQRSAAVRERLAEVQRRSASPPVQDSPAIPDVTDAEWAEYRRILILLERVYQTHVDSLGKLDEVRRVRRAFQNEATAGNDARESGAATARTVDELWHRVWDKEREIQGIRFEENLLLDREEDLRSELKNSEQALREADEQLEAAAPGSQARARWLKELTEWRHRETEARLALFDTERELRAELLAFRHDELDQWRRKALAASRSSPLTAADRDARLAALDQIQQALDAEIQSTAEADRTAQARLLAASRLSASSTGGGGSQDGDAARLRQEFDTLKAESEAASITLKVLRLRSFALVLQRGLWERRYDIDRQSDLPHLKAALADIQEGLGRLKDWRDYLKSTQDLARRRVGGLEKQLAEWQPQDGDRTLVERERGAFARLEDRLQSTLTAADDLDGTLHGWQEMLRLRLETATPAERMAGLGSALGTVAHQAWDYELLVVEDKVTVEGREIVGQRRVTLGKVLQVLLILGVGLWLNGRVARHGLRVLLRRLPGRESAVLLAVRLFGTAVVMGLVVVALLIANIPLSVFTFLGGALAIGLGFGAQNLINNFISGLILLVERPIKLGDIVDIEGVRGRITQIGSRCSEVRRFDGIDMLIPNSAFLEKNVTNWTLSDPHLRRTITVGVAYGSPTRQAAALIRQVAEQHPQILKDPAPEVYLDEFGESALTLRLDFWVDVAVEPNWLRITSDLRHSLVERLGEAGIVIAFPQRDVRLDSVPPVKVELVTPGPWAIPAVSDGSDAGEQNSGSPQTHLNRP